MSSKAEPGAMTIEEIELARSKVLENSWELMADAQLLFERERYARAYTLAHLAWEELARLPMLFRAGQDLLCGIKVDWRKLRARLRDHHEKIDAHAERDYLLPPVKSDNSDVAVYEDALKKTRLLNDTKNYSLYAEEVDGRWCKPSELIGKASAAEAIERTEKAHQFYQAGEKATAGRLRQIYASSKEREDWRQLRVLMAFQWALKDLGLPEDTALGNSRD